MTTLADDLVPDQLWAIVEPLLPAPPRPPYGGRHRTISDRACLAAIVYMGPHLHPLAAAARPRAGLRLARDLLAAPHRVGQRQRLRAAPPGGLGPPW
jgi:transposase